MTTPPGPPPRLELPPATLTKAGVSPTVSTKSELDVAVYDAFCMGMLQSVAHLGKNAYRAIGRQRSVFLNLLCKRHAFNQIHHQKRKTIAIGARIVYFHNVGMIKTGGCVSFLLLQVSIFFSSDAMTYSELEQGLIEFCGESTRPTPPKVLSSVRLRDHALSFGLLRNKQNDEYFLDLLEYKFLSVQSSKSLSTLLTG